MVPRSPRGGAVRGLFRCWTGPVLVKDVARMMREAGVTVHCEGTEHVLIVSEGETRDGAAWNVLASLYRKHGTDVGLRPELLREV